MKRMNVIGSIRFQATQAARLRELTLERAVATVDQEEARNGASTSDSIRLASRDQNKDEKVPFHVYLQRVAKFKAGLKKSKEEECKSNEPECPIKKARAESTTGENVPLNWLIADHFGGDGEAVPESSPEVFQSEAEQMAVASTFTLQPSTATEPQSLMDNEWLISPNS